jgi:hypothetical protein
VLSHEPFRAIASATPARQTRWRASAGEPRAGSASRRWHEEADVRVRIQRARSVDCEDNSLQALAQDAYLVRRSTTIGRSSPSPAFGRAGAKPRGPAYDCKSRRLASDESAPPHRFGMWARVRSASPSNFMQVGGSKRRSDWPSPRKRACMWTSAAAEARWTTLSPGDRADPGLASLRGLDWLGPHQRREGFVHVHQTHRHAPRPSKGRRSARGPLTRRPADAKGRRGAEGREQADLLSRERDRSEDRRAGLATQ